MLFNEHRTLFFYCMEGVMYAFLLTLSIAIVKVIWFNTPFLLQ